MNKKKEQNHEIRHGLKYQFIADIPSSTRVTAVHIKVDGVNYRVLHAPIPRLYDEVSAFEANKKGDVLNYNKPIILLRSTDIELGIETLIKKLAEQKGVNSCCGCQCENNDMGAVSNTKCIDCIEEEED